MGKKLGTSSAEQGRGSTGGLNSGVRHVDYLHPPLALFALGAALVAAAPAAAAESYPSKPIRILVTATPGGPPDILARWLAERLVPALAVPIVVDNRPGAGGNIAMQAAAHSAPDGYTLVVAGQGPFALNPHLYAKPGYNPIADFAPITLIERGALLLAVNADVPVHSVAELIALARRGQAS